MGLSVTASHVIWFFAFLGLAGGALGAFFDLSGAFEHAQAERRAIDEEKLHAFIAAATFCWDGGAQTVTLNATNAGQIVLDVEQISFLLDGSLAAGFAATSQDGATTGLWPPGEWARFTKTGVSVEPANVMLATEHGLVVRATKTTCS
jgi:archaellum component FlaF (FlaF/FlaG flagellin family)